MKANTKRGIAFAMTAAVLYAVNLPFSKIMLTYMPPTLMAGFLYLGAGLGMFFIKLFGRNKKEEKLTRADLPYTIAMIVLDIAAPICLLVGLNSTSASAASLLNNFEIVATAVIALFIFKEKISVRLWLGIGFVTTSCILLSANDFSHMEFSTGSLFILLAAVCWGLENNCTRAISSKNPLEIVLIKGVFSGTGSIIMGLCIGERLENPQSIPIVLLIGVVAYGLSIFFYIYAQRTLGAARTSAYYATSPFIGALLSLIIFREKPATEYLIAFLIMIIGAWLSLDDKPISEIIRRDCK